MPNGFNLDGFPGLNYTIRARKFIRIARSENPEKLRKYAGKLQREAKNRLDLRLFRFSLMVIDAAIAFEMSQEGR